MKIYSWNMLFKNAQRDRALAFIRDATFDVFCLQEVPPAFLEQLRTLPYNIASAVDTERVERDSEYQNFCVVLTPHRILSSEQIEFQLEPRRWRTKVFQACMWGLRRLDRRGSLIADIELPIGRAQVFCLHLTLSYPARVLREFNLALHRRNGSPLAIVCGDFNVLESFHITVLNWLLGGRIRDVFAWRSSRKEFQQAFARLGLQNPLRGARTQRESLSQLDHILVPASANIVSTKVFSDRVGSDHNPIFVEFE